MRFEGDVVAAVAALTPEIAEAAAALVEIELEELPAFTDPELALAGVGLADPPRVGVVRGRRGRRPVGQLGIALHDRQGRCRRGHGRGRGRRPRALRRRHVACRADRAARGDRAVGGRSRHHLVVDAGAVPRAQHGRPHAPAARVERARDRAAARWGLRRQVRAALRGARGGARARRPAPGQAGLLAARGVHRAGSPARGHGDRARDRRQPRRHAGRAPRHARDRQRRLHGRCRVLPAARRDARRGAVQGAAHLGRGRPRLHEQRAVRLGAGADRAAGLLGARAAPRCRGARDRDGSGRAPPPQHRARGRRGPDAADLQPDRRGRDPRARLRADRLRQGAAGGRGDRRRVRLVAVVHAGLRRVREARGRRLGHDRDRRHGVRHRCRDGAADPRRRGARHASGGLQHPLAGHRRRVASTAARPARRRRSTTARP